MLAIALLPLACNYDFPLLPAPSRAIDSRLIGEWTTTDESGETEVLIVRKYDADHYVVLSESQPAKAFQIDVARAYHTDFDGLQLVTAQVLNDERKYLVLQWSLNADATRLKLQSLSIEVVPERTKDRATMMKLIRANRHNPKLFGEVAEYTRVKPAALHVGYEHRREDQRAADRK